jgi:hypothetical protein
MTGSESTRSPSAAHRPDLAAHVDEVKAAAGQFAHRHDVTAMDRGGRVWRRVLNPLQVSGVEMLRRRLFVDAPAYAPGSLHLFLHVIAESGPESAVNVHKRP